MAIIYARVWFSLVKSLFLHESRGAQLQPTAYLWAVGGGQKKEKVGPLWKWRPENIIFQDWNSMRLCLLRTLMDNVVHRLCHIFSSRDGAWREVPHVLLSGNLSAVTLTQASPYSPLIFLKISFTPNSKVQFWMWPAASKNKVILLGLSRERRAWP